MNSWSLDVWAGAFALAVNFACAIAAFSVARDFWHFRRIPRWDHAAWSWLAHGVVVAWIATGFISAFWGAKWVFQTTGDFETAFWLSKYGGFFDAVWRATLIWGAISHKIAAQKQ